MAEKPETDLLNLAAFQPVTESLGPGRRFALWAQGCPFNCKGCIAPDWIPFQAAQVEPIAAVAELILRTEDLAGLSISGGEPMMQAGRFARLVAQVKKERPGLNLIVFSGFELHELVWEEARSLLQYTDVLIAGVYIQRLNEGKGLRGSSNQTVHFLSDALAAHRDYFYNCSRKLEFHIREDGVLMAGIPNEGFKW